ncbi:hypothetical protein F4805DRAFT_439089 [Annulohypoxylon moriforme]|nr:hypothetical protein F4805DRAFT_439089 [Annulohypoxylon moriforme]
MVPVVLTIPVALRASYALTRRLGRRQYHEQQEQQEQHEQHEQHEAAVLTYPTNYRTTEPWGLLGNLERISGCMNTQ